MAHRSRWPQGAGRSVPAFQHTPYRFSTLIERAKQLAGVPQQVEQPYLSAIEKYDAERYALFKARQDMALAYAEVDLQGFRAQEAADGVTLAGLQQDRAVFQIQRHSLPARVENRVREWTLQQGLARRTKASATSSTCWRRVTRRSWSRRG